MKHTIGVSISFSFLAYDYDYDTIRYDTTVSSYHEEGESVYNHSVLLLLRFTFLFPSSTRLVFDEDGHSVLLRPESTPYFLTCCVGTKRVVFKYK